MRISHSKVLENIQRECETIALVMGGNTINKENNRFNALNNNKMNKSHLLDDCDN